MGDSDISRNRIALCLSGGGFRATLFHLGMVKALRMHEILGEMALKRVDEVFAVSGGSILAAHMLKNFERYTSDKPEEFEAVCHEVLAFAKRDMRNRVLRRWGLTGLLRKTRGHWMQREYEVRRFLGKDTLDDCYKHDGLPIFHFLATSFNSGELCSFSGTDFELTERIDDKAYKTHRTPAGSISLGFAVAASSSFPIAFPPITLTPGMLGRPEGTYFSMPIELSDGGVFDNFGIDKFVQAMRTGEAPDILIVSNAGGSFQADPEKSYGDIVGRNMRASDVLMRRVGEASIAAGRKIGGNGFTLVRIGATTKSSQISQTTQQLLRLVRTDLDRFDYPLAGLLIDHGEGVARDAFGKRGWKAKSKFVGHDKIKDQQAGVKAIEQASRRANAPLIFDFRDFVWLLAWYVLIAGLAFGVYRVQQLYIDYRANKEATELAVTIADTRAKTRAAVEPMLYKASDALATGEPQKAMEQLNTALEELGSARRTEVKLSPAESGAPAVQPVRETLRTQDVYIQFAGELTRAQITSLNTALREAGWKAQGKSGERLGRAAGLNEVRFSGENRAAAQELADALNKSGLPGGTVKVKNLDIIQGNVLEVWISN